MGIISLTAFNQETSNIKVPYYLVDKYITINDFLIKDKLNLESILSSYPHLNIHETLKEKEDQIKKRRALKLYKMSYMFYKNTFEVLSSQELLSKDNDSSLQHNENENLIFNTSISEQSMREYHALNQTHYESRILKGPPVQYRWLSWLITASVPANRLKEGYMNLLEYSISEALKTQIKTTINTFFGHNYINSLSLKQSAFNVCKAIFCFDNEISNSECVIALACFFLIISGRNEIEVFYLLLSILSGTFKSTFNMRFMFCNDCPLMEVLLRYYEKMSDVHLKKLMTFFSEKNYSLKNLFRQYFCLCFLNAFSYRNVMRIFDCLLVKGISFFVSMALSMTEFLQKNIMKSNDTKEIIDLFTQFSRQANDINPTGFIFNIEDLINNALQKYDIKKEEFEKEIKNMESNFNMNYVYEYRNIKKNEETETDKEEEKKERQNEEVNNYSQHSEEHNNSYENSEKENENENEIYKDNDNNSHNASNSNENLNEDLAAKTIRTIDVDNEEEEEEDVNNEIEKHVMNISTNEISFVTTNRFVNKKQIKKI